MLTNPRDAFRGQARSPNMIPFDMLGMVSNISGLLQLCPSLRYWTCTVTLKPGLGVTQGIRSRKSPIFSHPVYFVPQLNEVPLRIGYRRKVENVLR